LSKYYKIAIKWVESTHFPGRNDPGPTGNRSETTRGQQVIGAKRPGRPGRIDPGPTGNRGETTRYLLGEHHVNKESYYDLVWIL